MTTMTLLSQHNIMLFTHDYLLISFDNTYTVVYQDGVEVSVTNVYKQVPVVVSLTFIIM